MSASPLVAGTAAELARALGNRRRPVALVPTMGALHAGHATLIDRARTEVAGGMGGDVAGGTVVVSVFVNPLQFAPGEDLDRYPRTFDADLELAGRHGADMVFAPAITEVYPTGDPVVTVDPGPLGTVLEGASRPTHFRGVLTVVAKLFGLVRPDLAVFGEKDYQQLVLVRRMAAELCLGVRVVGAETVRDADGLALSSRNRYLSPQERSAALSLSRALHAAQSAAAYGIEEARAAALRELAGPGVELDYLALRDPELGELAADRPAGAAGRALVAARVGTTRLIDNLPITVGSAPGGPGPATRTPREEEIPCSAP